MFNDRLSVSDRTAAAVTVFGARRVGSSWLRSCSSMRDHRCAALNERKSLQACSRWGGSGQRKASGMPKSKTSDLLYAPPAEGLACALPGTVWCIVVGVHGFLQVPCPRFAVAPLAANQPGGCQTSAGQRYSAPGDERTVGQSPRLGGRALWSAIRRSSMAQTSRRTTWCSPMPIPARRCPSSFPV